MLKAALFSKSGTDFEPEQVSRRANIFPTNVAF